MHRTRKVRGARLEAIFFVEGKCRACSSAVRSLSEMLSATYQNSNSASQRIGDGCPNRRREQQCGVLSQMAKSIPGDFG